MNLIIQQISAALNIPLHKVEAVLQLLEEGSTIPFIARYRKDKTGNLDEVQIAQIQEQEKQLKAFEDRKSFITQAITQQEKMTEAIAEALAKATSLPELEDIYLPFKPKRKTKAQVAKSLGLEPLANWLLLQNNGDSEAEASKYVNENVASTSIAIQGALDIVAEIMYEEAETRQTLRQLFEREGLVITKLAPGKETEGIKFKDYFDFQEPISKIPSHRALAVLRGFTEGMLRLSIKPEDALAISTMEERYIKGVTRQRELLGKAIKDCWTRLLQPSLESEFRMALKHRSDEEAILVFAQNLRQLLFASPLGGKRLLAIDPGYRTGCKTVVLNEQGDLMEDTVIYIHEPGQLAGATKTIHHLFHLHQIEAFAIGDGTAGRETEKFIRSLDLKAPIFMVNEDGASIYSASEIAREEFPNQDITVRGAISIGRRLMDPLAELVKIDPKSIGVGQYQHDVNQIRLKEKLDQTVESCVNAVGVNLNTAGKHLLRYVSGIGDSLASNIVEHRRKIGRFTSRNQLKEVSRLGEKAFEQSAGFLRIPGAINPLDNSSVHPESYGLVQKIADKLEVEIEHLVGNEKLAAQVKPADFPEAGAHELSVILKELVKPGLDPRQPIETFEFANVYSVDDLIPGAELPGIVTNLTRFGAFVDLGVKQDGLVHVSEIAHRYISDPAEVLKLGDRVTVKVLEVDPVRKRISLSIKQATPLPKNAGKQLPKDARKIKREPQESTSMNDALNQLKSKFAKQSKS